MDKKQYWLDKLSETRSELNKLIEDLTEEQWQTRVYSEDQTWTVLDIVSHLVDSESGMSIHVYKIRKGRETIPEDFDLDKWNAGVKKRVGQVTPADLRDQLQQTRAKTLEGLKTLEEDEWELTGRHPVGGIITIEQYYETIASHEAEHTRDIKQALGL